MKQIKKVSIIIPYYNQEEFIDECIESVLCQTYQNYEIIIVNDGSTSRETKKILNDMIGKSPKIKVINKLNTGVSDTRNVGIHASSGEYILPLDADDKLQCTCLEKKVRAIEENKGDVIYSITKLFGEKNNIFGLPKYNAKKILKKNMVVCTALYTRETYHKIESGYDKNMVYGLEDWEFWISMTEKNAKFYRINEGLFFYRIKKQSRNKTMQYGIENAKKIKEMYEYIFNKHKELYKQNDIYRIEDILPPPNTFLNKLKNKLKELRMRAILRIMIENKRKTI